MNRIYSLVWNRALRTVQVASELARPAHGGGAGANAAPARRRPLALACVAALGMAALVLPTWSAAACPPGSTTVPSTSGAAGTTDGNGNGTAGSNAYAANSTDNLCVTSGALYGGAGGYGNPGTGTGSVSSTGGAGGAGISGSGFTLTNGNGSYTRIEGGDGGYGYAAGGAGGAGVIDTGGSVTNYGRVNGGSGGYSALQGGVGGAGMAVTGTTIVNGNSGSIYGGGGGDAGYASWRSQGDELFYPTNGTGGAGGAGVTGSDFNLTNTGRIGGGYAGWSDAFGVAMGSVGGAGVSGSGFTLTNGGGSKYARVEGGGGSGAWAYVAGGSTPGAYVATGGMGGAGVAVSGSTTTTITNTSGGSIRGGGGGGAYFYDYSGSPAPSGSSFTGVGGAGGAGISVDSTGTTSISNASGGYIHGGHGGNAGFYGNDNEIAATSAIGGAGGAGVAGGAFSLDNDGNISGGDGGGSYAYAAGAATSGYAATGGAGGAGVTGTGFKLTNGGGIYGARGGEGYGANGGAGMGGTGGAGVIGSGFKLTNQGYISGGTGGEGVSSYSVSGSKGTGSVGGAGVSGSGFYVSNSSTIMGGDGGGGYAYGAATGGAGGAGIAGSGVALVNSGFVAGGRGGDSYTYVNGAQSSGYVSTSGASGAGVSISNVAGATSSITNTVDGVIVGGESAGTAYEDGRAPAAASVTVVGNGGMGGAGINIDGAGTTTVANAGFIGGGYGGYAYVCDGSPCSTYTGNGGKGGDGINVAGSGSTTITNTGYINGGGGGNAWSYGSGYVPGTVGAGGAGINVSSTGTTTIDNSGYIYGGGAGSGRGSRAAVGGAGVTGTGFKLTNSGGIYGGYGYRVGTFNSYNGPGGYGYGGAGGAGVSGSGFSVTNTGTIGGGEGGSVGGYYSVAGAGGAGVSGSAFTLTNSGTIEGGMGGAVYAGCGPSLGGGVGAGGVGIDAMGRVSVITSGSIMGGLSGNGTAQADAADFSGGGNSLTLESGYSFVGNVVSSSGTTAGGDTLALGGTTDDTFDVSQIVATAPASWTGAVQYYGFANYAKVDGSTWTLTNTTTAVTPWTLAGGTLQISSDTNLGAPSGGLTFNGGTLENTAAITTARPITVQGAGTLQNDADFTSSGSVSGAGALTKTGAGTLIFNGNGSAFSGSTNVTTGLMLVGNDGFSGASLGGTTTVAAGATLGGFGTIGSLDLFGNLSPGASIGTLHATGGATFESGSAYLLDVTPAGQSDLFTTTGAVTITGGTVQVQPSTGSWAPITKYTIVTGAGGVSGTFAGLTGAPTPHWGLLYDSNDVYLILGTDAFNLADAAQTVNQRNTAAGVSGLGWGSPLFLTLAAQDASAQRVAFDQTSGEFNASQQAALINDSRFVREQMNKRLRDGDADDSAAKVAGTKLTAWVHGWGHWGQIDGDGNAAQMSDNGDGLLVGADLPVGASGRVGFTGGAERNSLSVRDRSSWADVTQTWLGTYGGFEQGAFAFRAGVAYAWNRIPAYRDVSVAGMAPQTLSSNAIGNTTTGYIEGAWNIQTAAGKLAPYLNLANVRVHTDASNETGGIAALHMNSASMDTSLSTLGVRGNWQLASKVALDANLGWVHAFGDITPERTQQFLAGDGAFTVYGTPLAQNAGQVNVNLTWQVAPNAQVVLGYDGLYGSHVKDTAAKASFNVAF